MLRRALLLLAVLVVVPPILVPAARAQTPPAVHLEALTWTEVRDRLQAGHTTILLPLGGTEQNGPAMALGKHNARARLLAEKIAQRLDSAIVAPVVAYVPEGNLDPPSGHMRFAGTITVPEATFESLLEAAARSFERHGFRDIVLLADSGGYQKQMNAVVRRLNREWAKGPTRVHAVHEYYRAATIEFGRMLAQRGFTQAEIGTHAGLADTSLMLALDPQWVRIDRLASAAAPAQGVAGDPARASAELGRLGIDAIVDRAVDAIRKATAR
ncbi:MAG TPA: creatininase family protein [Burkholderiaceae bacterium]|nr:creatininase family protein [Burkholderiaceae bacterium]